MIGSNVGCEIAELRTDVFPLPDLLGSSLRRGGWYFITDSGRRCSLDNNSLVVALGNAEVVGDV